MCFFVNNHWISRWPPAAILNISLSPRIQKKHLSEYCSLTCPLQESKVNFCCDFNVYGSIGQNPDYSGQTNDFNLCNTYLLLKGGPWFDDGYIRFMLSLVKVTIWYTCTHIHTHTQTHTHTSGKAAQYSPKLQSELNNSIVIHIQL